MEIKRHLFLLTKYSRYSTSVISPKTEKKYRCNFQNGIYTTDNDDEAVALRNGRYFNLDYVADKDMDNEVKEHLKIKDKYGDDAELVKKLNAKKRTELLAICGQVKRKADNMNIFFKFTKEQAIDYILENKHKL